MIVLQSLLCPSALSPPATVFRVLRSLSWFLAAVFRCTPALLCLLQSLPIHKASTLSIAAYSRPPALPPPAGQPATLFICSLRLPAGLNNIVVKAFWCAFSLPPLVVPLHCTFLSGRLRLPAHPVWLAWRTWWRYGRPCFCQSFLLSSSRPPCQLEYISSVKKSMIVQKLYHHNTGIV